MKHDVPVEIHPVPESGPASAAAAPDPRVCLLFVFNHRFEGNIAALERLYRSRFRHIFYLMPFYRGERADVIPVYHSSHQFQGYFVDAWARLRTQNFTHFLLVGDDVLLHPRLNEDNICAELGLHARRDSAYIKALHPISDSTCRWPFLMRVLVAVAGNSGVNWEKELPDDETALGLLREKGLVLGDFGLRTVCGPMTLRSFHLLLWYFVLRLRGTRRKPGSRFLAPPYPLVESYSDFVAVPAAAMERFCHLCGVFAAMGVFAEVAVPTALVFSCPHIVQERDTRWRPREFWLGPAYDLFRDERGGKLDELLARFTDDELYCHPVKLSQWK